MSDKLVSKVLVLDDSPAHAEAIKQFCEENNLVALKVRKNRLMAVLRSNIDLGAILYSERYGATPEETAEIALRIHTVRPELPLILRRDSLAAPLDNPILAHVCCASYSTDDLAGLGRIVAEYLFSLVYPNALVRGILDITENVLAAQFPRLTPSWDTPYIVRDRMIFGEVFSLIPLESAWCRGYMMLQAEEQPILDLLAAERAGEGDANFREVNSLLGEVTNLIWGAFKNRYIGDDHPGRAGGVNVQVPLIVNHKHKFISFGTENPQLCFLYTLKDEAGGRSIRLSQRFVFNLSWSPEDFREIVPDAGELVEAGELELF